MGISVGVMAGFPDRIISWDTCLEDYLDGLFTQYSNRGCCILGGRFMFENDHDRTVIKQSYQIQYNAVDCNILL